MRHRKDPQLLAQGKFVKNTHFWHILKLRYQEQNKIHFSKQSLNVQIYLLLMEVICWLMHDLSLIQLYMQGIWSLKIVFFLFQTSATTQFSPKLKWQIHSLIWMVQIWSYWPVCSTWIYVRGWDWNHLHKFYQGVIWKMLPLHFHH